jgi:hypothetical protein
MLRKNVKQSDVIHRQGDRVMRLGFTKRGLVAHHPFAFLFTYIFSGTIRSDDCHAQTVGLGKVIQTDETGRRVLMKEKAE